MRTQLIYLRSKYLSRCHLRRLPIWLQSSFDLDFPPKVVGWSSHCHWKKRLFWNSKQVPLRLSWLDLSNPKREAETLRRPFRCFVCGDAKLFILRNDERLRRLGFLRVNIYRVNTGLRAIIALIMNIDREQEAFDCEHSSKVKSTLRAFRSSGKSSKIRLLEQRSPPCFLPSTMALDIRSILTPRRPAILFQSPKAPVVVSGWFQLDYIHFLHLQCHTPLDWGTDWVHGFIYTFLGGTGRKSDSLEPRTDYALVSSEYRLQKWNSSIVFYISSTRPY